MPALRKPESADYQKLPPRQALRAGRADVLSVGGGPAGLGAALGARQAGAHVILAERYGFLGGNATAALVMPLMSFHTQKPVPPQPGNTSLLPQDHGLGTSVIAGVLRTFLDRLSRDGGAIRPSLATGYVVPFDPEIFKLTALKMIDEAGVDFFFHAFASGVIDQRRIKGVIFETKSGPVVIEAKTVVDATGDGDIAALAGAPYEVGREEDGLVQPMTLMFRMADFEKRAFDTYISRHPDQWRGVHGLWDLIRMAQARGELDLPREDVLFFATPHPHEVSVNSTRVTQALGTDVWHLTYAEWKSRMQMEQISAFLRHYVPGFETSYVVQSGVNIGVRETRRIVGEYQLTVEDSMAARKFEDGSARCTYPVEIQNPKGSGTLLKRVPPGEAYDIPLRALLPQRVDNLVVSGRCISGTHEAHSTYRVMPVAMATGHAAGVCAALAAKQGKFPRDVHVHEVQEELLAHGANLGEQRSLRKHR
jgi:ribulose 1,5-bisphosphate synthetase/thiazole synthase